MRPREFLILLVILLLATGLRLYRLNEKSFWVDEFATSQLALGYGYAHHELPRNVLIERPPDLFNLAAARPLHKLWCSEVHGHVPPLWLVVSRLWGELFGLGQTSARVMSVVFSVAAIPVLFLVVRDLSGTTAALWAALLMALAGPQIQYAQEARNYSLLVLQGLIAAAALVRIERHGASLLREITLGLAVLAMALTHYFSLGAIIALAVYAGVRLRGRTLARVAACFAAAAVLWAILGLPLALRHARNITDPRATAFLRDDAPHRAVANVQRLGLLPVRYFTEPIQRARAPAAVMGAIAMLLPILLIMRRRDLVLWSLWLWLTVLPLLALDVIRGTQHLSFIRYTMLASPALYAIVAALLVDSPRRWLRHLPPALIALACAGALPAAYEAWWKADWRGVATAVDADLRPGDVTMYFDDRSDGTYAGDPGANFAYTSFYRRRPFGPVVLMDRPPDEALAKQVGSFGGAVIVAQHGEDVSPAVPADATLRRVHFEPGAAVVWRAEWSPTPAQP